MSLVPTLLMNRELNPVNESRDCGRIDGTVSVRALACAIIEQAVFDVRLARRRGYLTEGGKVKEIRRVSCRKKGIENREEAMEHVVRDAVDFFHDGRLERVCDVINSRIVHADRIRAQVRGELVLGGLGGTEELATAKPHKPVRRAK